MSLIKPKLKTNYFHFLNFNYNNTTLRFVTSMVGMLYLMNIRSFI